MIRLRVLGSTELQDTDGRELSAVLAQPKRLALLSYLAVVHGFHRRDTLLALFWPDLDTSRSREALNRAVRFLRKELGGSPGSVTLSRGTGELGIESGALRYDAATFRYHFESKRYGEALDLYRGDLLPGFFADDSGGFEDGSKANERVSVRRLLAPRERSPKLASGSRATPRRLSARAARSSWPDWMNASFEISSRCSTDSAIEPARFTPMRNSRSDWPASSRPSRRPRRRRSSNEFGSARWLEQTRSPSALRSSPRRQVPHLPMPRLVPRLGKTLVSRSNSDPTS